MKTQSSAETQKRKRLLLFLPLLILPFTTMAFWALGGGKGNVKPFDTLQKGFNTNLPNAKFDDTQKQDKLSIYESFAQSQRSKELSDTDFQNIPLGNQNDAADNEIQQKLAQLTSALNQPDNQPQFSPSKSPRPKTTGGMDNDVNRLESLMKNMVDKGDDPEMKQLNGILEKIMDIQHPGRTQERMENQRKDNPGALTVHTLNNKNSQIYQLAKSLKPDLLDPNTNTIKAVIHQTQEVVSGSVVKLRLLDSIIINGTIIPKNQMIYGLAHVNNERLEINLKTLRYKNSILPVSLSAFDLDGLEGLFIPGAMNRDASKEGVDDALQNLQIMTMDPSIGAQAASAGVQAAKGLFRKKVKQIRVELKAGYQLLLRDNNQ
nr:conjugative transposon protein TraM [uncultured Pedobacter sp.]